MIVDTGRIEDGLPVFSDSETMPLKGEGDAQKPQDGVALCFTLKTGQELPLPSGKHIVGRGSDADIKLLDSTVSRKHAEILVLQDQIVIVDLGSINGTSVNGARISIKELRPGEMVKFGNVQCLLCWKFDKPS